MSFDDALPGDLQDDDRLFNVDGGPWQMNTRMAWSFIGDYRYIGGFLRAAEVLGDHAARHRADVDVLTMPILFCYRQWAELRLKDLWLDAALLRSTRVDPLRTHNLRVLWRHVRPIIEEVWPEGERVELDRLARVLDELADFDGPQGTAFRYATDNQGQPSLPTDLDINLYTVRVTMAKVARLLDGAAEGLAHALELKAEMDDYYADE